MKKFVIILLVLVAAVAAVITCPNEQDHRETMEPILGRVASQVAQEKTSGVGKVLKAIGLGNNEKVKNGYDKVGKALAPALAMMIRVDDYYLFSIGKMKYQGSVYPVSLGLYDHVFALPLDKIEAAMAETEDEEE